MVEDVCRRTREDVASCWGRFGLAALWRRLKRIGMPRRYGLSAGGYDLLSYSQNFDDGKVCECEPGFLARFAARQASSMPTPVVVVKF